MIGSSLMDATQPEEAPMPKPRGRDWNALIVLVIGAIVSLWIGVRHSSVAGALVILLIAVASATAVHIIRNRRRRR